MHSTGRRKIYFTQVITTYNITFLYSFQQPRSLRRRKDNARHETNTPTITDLTYMNRFHANLHLYIHDQEPNNRLVLRTFSLQDFYCVRRHSLSLSYTSPAYNKLINFAQISSSSFLLSFGLLVAGVSL